jgi:hypothetical protein
MNAPSRRTSDTDHAMSISGRVEVDVPTGAYEPPCLVELGSLAQLTMHHHPWHHHEDGHGHGGFHHHGSF